MVNRDVQFKTIKKILIKRQIMMARELHKTNIIWNERRGDESRLLGLKKTEQDNMD